VRGMPTAKRGRRAQRLTLDVPVQAEVGGQVMAAEVLGSTANVLLLQGPEGGVSLPSLGTSIRLRLDCART
jgi:hypothetical protein